MEQKLLLILIIIITLSNLIFSEEKIDLEDLTFFSNFINLTKEDKNFKAEYDFNNDGIIDYSDYSLLLNYYGSTKGDSNYNEKYDIVKEETKKETGIQKTIKELESVQLKMETIFLKPEKYIEIKLILEKIKSKETKFIFFDKESIVVISDESDKIQEYKRVINYIENNSKVKAKKKEYFLER
ncbi:MAG TPA: hypothetical protein PLD27_03455 [bacterium]|nr:hypothetical protein [bacterium]HOL48813.1 hypothetical protein [bacterium]HPQ18756.1 hypothetical protein [bacterium]